MSKSSPNFFKSSDMTLEGKIQWLMDRPEVWLEVDNREELDEITNIMEMIGFECDWWISYNGPYYMKVCIS